MYIYAYVRMYVCVCVYIIHINKLVRECESRRAWRKKTEKKGEKGKGTSVCR